MAISSWLPSPAGVWELSTWSPRSAARRNDVDGDERRQMLGREEMAIPDRAGWGV
jgi:hypothetical protein